MPWRCRLQQQRVRLLIVRRRCGQTGMLMKHLEMTHSMPTLTPLGKACT